ncbi:GIY-YIG nuclease family protein [Candidatus Bathyarchaeota archaeon]|nr:MAG: GIY-YIG nuclease family protein [Candidatus Bathyarchaeota archaeon]
MVSRGAYCLCIAVEREVAVEVGALGRRVFAPGCYIYVGSAMNGLEARVRRHLNTSRGVFKAVHWHIDYLLKEAGVRVEAVYTRLSDERIECFIAAAVSRRGQPVKGFGCTDCRCESHLFQVEDCGFLTEFGLKLQPLSDFSGGREMPIY